MPIWLLWLCTQVPAPQDAETVLAAMDKSSAEIQTLVGAFERIKRLSLMDDEARSAGTFTYRRENRAIRWDSNESGDVQQLEGDRYIEVFRKLKEIEVYTLDQRGKQLAAIMGAPDVSKTLRQDFDIVLGEHRNGEVELKLSPRSEDMRKRVKQAVLRVRTDRYIIAGVSYSEPNGDSVEIKLTKLRLNEKLSPNAFDLDLDGLVRSGYKLTKH